MRHPEDETENDGHPLAGVLDRLLSRERGAARDGSRGGADVLESPGVQPVGSCGPPSDACPRPRRMLVIAGLGPTRGFDALVALARWGAQGGRRVAVVDFESASRSSTPAPPEGLAVGAQVPMASLPCGLASLRREDAGTVAAIVERLRRLESAADLLLVRMSAADRRGLVGAAMMAGGLIVPVDGGDRAVHAAFRLARELVESLPGLFLVPFASDPAAIELFGTMARDFLGVSVEALDGEGAAVNEVLDPLAAPPAEGFLAALLAGDASGPPSPHLLELGTLEI